MQATIQIPKVARIFPGSFTFHTKHTAQLPTTWSELRLHHFPALEVFFATVAALKSDDFAGIIQANATLFCAWMGIDPLHAKNKQIAYNSEVMKLGYGFLTEKHSLTPLQKRTAGMAGPGSQLTNLRYQQFILAETIYERYRTNPNPNDITLLATITHRAKWMPYLPALASFRYYIFKHLVRKSVKIKALFTYIAQRSHLPERYPELYSGSKSGQTLYVDQQILNQCGAELGSFNQVASAPLHRVLELMQLKEIQAIKNNPNYAKHKATVEELHKKAGYKSTPHWAK